MAGYREAGQHEAKSSMARRHLLQNVQALHANMRRLYYAEVVVTALVTTHTSTDTNLPSCSGYTTNSKANADHIAVFQRPIASGRRGRPGAQSAVRRRAGSCTGGGPRPLTQSTVQRCKQHRDPQRFRGLTNFQDDIAIVYLSKPLSFNDVCPFALISIGNWTSHS
ncbi:hypothetical protein EVAR_76114_1 [Eumeta japonica]|uniref:Uncharacterized protein n=1 Tax=Eumeta variegata TaxID=151549 RepID=A0A4C1W2T0_EUMVA|nr:hypothetical protein EVAR_76114_1 [Eumeta japonica]